MASAGHFCTTPTSSAGSFMGSTCCTDPKAGRGDSRPQRGGIATLEALFWLSKVQRTAVHSVQLPALSLRGAGCLGQGWGRAGQEGAAETCTAGKWGGTGRETIWRGTEHNQKPSQSPILIFKSRQAPLTFIRAWYSALPTEFRAVHRYTPPSLICGLVTFMWLTVVPSDMVYWLVRCPLSRGMGSSSRAQVTVGGGAPLAAHIRENCSPGFTTFSLKEETMRGVPSGGTQREGG